jgi:hypothetical protein
MSMSTKRLLDAEFVNAEVYAIYKAITEVSGQDGWKIMWRSGELMFDQIEPKLQFPSRDPLDVLRTVGEYLKQSGYFEGIELELLPGGVLEYQMYNTSTRPAAARLIQENAILPHWSTVVMVAALRKICGVEAKMEAHDHKPELVSQSQSKERWILLKDGQPLS